MSSLPILYSLTSQGSLLSWQIEVQGSQYRTTAGQVGGTLTVSQWTTCIGKNSGKKNETSAEEQAQLEAQSKWDKKVKQGSSPYPEYAGRKDAVMLASKYLDRLSKINWVGGVVTQCKFNGGRMWVTNKGAFTRGREPQLAVPHIVEALQPIFQQYPDAFIDGELFCNEYRTSLNQTMSIIRKSKPTEDDLILSREKIRYHVYDGFGIGGLSEKAGYLNRYNQLKLILKDIPYVDVVESQICQNHAEVMTHYEKLLADSQEGIIVRMPSSPYEFKRSANLLKMKPTDDGEFEIVDVVEGEGNRSNMAGKVMVKDAKGNIFGANMKGETSQFVEVWQNKANYIGKTATITFNGYTGLGTPNYAQFDCNNWNNSKK